MRHKDIRNSRFWRTFLFRGLAAPVAALMLVVAFAPLSVADDDDDDDQRGSSNQRRGEGEDRPRKPGQLNETDAAFDGRYVDFRLDLANCTIVDYRLYNITIFSSIQLAGECEADNRSGKERGHQLRVRSDAGELVIHDAPNGLIRFDPDEGTAVFHWGSIAAGNMTEKGLELLIGPNLTGFLRVHDSDDEDDDEDDGADGENSTGLTVGQGQAELTKAGGFWAHPLKGGSPERVEIRDAIKHGKIAGEIDVLLSDGTLSSEVLEYDNVTIRVGKHADSTFRVLVDANLTEGRTFVMNVGPGVFKHDRIGVQYYDEDEDGLLREVSIAKADDLADILEIADGEGPEYWITNDETGHHVLVSVPHFSVHVFEVSALSVEVLPSVLAGLALGVVVVAIAAVGMVPRRRLQ